VRDAGTVDGFSRGLYRLPDAELLGNPSLVTVALRVPEVMVSLFYALSFHNLIAQVAHAAHLAAKRGSEPARLDHAPTELFRFGGECFSSGIETHELDGMPARKPGRLPAVTVERTYELEYGTDNPHDAARRDSARPEAAAPGRTVGRGGPVAAWWGLVEELGDSLSPSLWWPGCAS